MAFNSNPGKQQFSASAGQTVFTFNFAIFANTDIKVYKTLAGAVGNDTNDLLTLTTHYTVSINGTVGGTVTLLTGAGVNDTITLARSLPLTRATDYVTNGDLYADTLDADQDYQTYLVLDQQTRWTRSVVLPDTYGGSQINFPTPSRYKFIRWNISLDGFENVDPSTVLSSSDAAIIENVTDFLSIDTSVYTTAIVKDINRGGTFVWSATGTANGGTVFAGLTGYWNRQYSGAVNVKWFDIANPNTAIANAFIVSKNVMIDSTITFSSAVTVPAYGTLSGGSGSSYLPIGTNAVMLASTAVDSVILSEGSCIQGFKIQNTVGNGIKLVEGRQATIRNCSVRGLTASGQKGLYTTDTVSWDIKIENTWFTKFDKGIELTNSYGTFVNCMITDNNTNLHLNNGHYQFFGGAIAHSYVADGIIGDDFTGDFYSAYNCKVVLNGTHLEANSLSTHTKFSVGSLSGSTVDRVSIVTNGLYIANNTSNAIWFDILSGVGSKINTESITGVDATYTEPVVKIRDTATNVTLSQISTFPIDKASKISYTSGRTGISVSPSTILSGKYTPVVTGGSVAGTGTYSSQTGSYAIVGSLITVNFFVNMSAHTGTGDMQISLPFTSALATVGADYYIGNVTTDNITLGTGSPSLRLGANLNKCIIKMSNTGAASTTVAIDGTGYLIGSITYQL